MLLKDSHVSAWDTVLALIAGNTSKTDKINLGGLRLFGLVMPAEWTIANLTFQASYDDGMTWHNVSHTPTYFKGGMIA